MDPNTGYKDQSYKSTLCGTANIKERYRISIDHNFSELMVPNGKDVIVIVPPYQVESTISFALYNENYEKISNIVKFNYIDRFSASAEPKSDILTGKFL